MAENQGRERDFVLAPNEFVFIQDQTKGQISVYVGPHKSTLASTDSPIVYDRNQRKFVQTDLQRAIQLFPTADEGFYITLENPSEAGARPHPELGTVNSLSKLRSGRKINIPGPQTFPLWPGQVAQVVEGHRLRTNQYLIVRVYNDEEARANQTSAVIRRVESSSPKSNLTPGLVTDQPAPEQASEAVVNQTIPELIMGMLIVIKGDEVSFYIPPTGIEVVPDDGQKYVREAVTLERLEYCVLLSEDGNKRYVKGPAVVFPEPTENFIPSASGGRKYKAIELNDDMGLYVKVTADYEEGNEKYHAGDELFITGREQRLYYPRAEHSIIKYGEREIHYGIAIPDGEARYVLDKQSGKVELVRGPEIFLPDPRTQVIVRRVLTEEETNYLYPGNKQATEHNSRLREIQRKSGDVVTDAQMRVMANASFDRRATRSVTSESAVAAFTGDEFNRGVEYSPPRTITLDTKFEGAVAINIWNGYAILIVNKEGTQRVEVGPKTVLLEYDETLQVLQLSTGKPKNTDRLEKTVYLRVRFNQVSDEVDVVTKDMVSAKIKLSYRVNFENEPAKWFMVENYVKFMTDHARSLLRNAAKKHTIEELNAHYIDIVRNTILGASEEGKRKGKLFEENGVLIYDVEVSNLTIGDAEIARMLSGMQQAAVRQTLDVASKERELAATKRTESIEREIADQEDETEKHKHGLAMAHLGRDKTRIDEEKAVQTATDEKADAANTAQLLRARKSAEQEIELEDKEQEQRIKVLEAEVKAVVDKAGAISPQLIAALQAFGDQKIAGDLAVALSPLAILGGESVADVIGKMLNGTAIGDIARNTLRLTNPAIESSRVMSRERTESPGNGITR